MCVCVFFSVHSSLYSQPTVNPLLNVYANVERKEQPKMAVRLARMAERDASSSSWDAGTWDKKAQDVENEVKEFTQVNQNTATTRRGTS